MNISVFTGKIDDRERVSSAEAAIEMAREDKADLMVLPGDSLGRRSNRDGGWQPLSEHSERSGWYSSRVKYPIKTMAMFLCQF